MTQRVISAVLFLGMLVMSVARGTPGTDMRSLVAHNDVVYLSPRQGWEGLPLGNGTLGAQMRQPDGLMFQLNTPLSGVYGGALCRVQQGSTPIKLTGLASPRPQSIVKACGVIASVWPSVRLWSTRTSTAKPVS
jgi:hypothetical protein